MRSIDNERRICVFIEDNAELLAPLLDYAGDLEIRDALGWTPLMTAVNRGSKHNVDLLLARGAKIDADWTKGMSLIADAMNYNDIGWSHPFHFDLIDDEFFSDRTDYHSDQSRRSSCTHSGYVSKWRRSKFILFIALRSRRWIVRRGQTSSGER